MSFSSALGGVVGLGVAYFGYRILITEFDQRPVLKPKVSAAPTPAADSGPVSTWPSFEAPLQTKAPEKIVDELVPAPDTPKAKSFSLTQKQLLTVGVALGALALVCYLYQRAGRRKTNNQDQARPNIQANIQENFQAAQQPARMDQEQGYNQFIQYSSGIYGQANQQANNQQNSFNGDANQQHQGYQDQNQYQQNDDQNQNYGEHLPQGQY